MTRKIIHLERRVYGFPFPPKESKYYYLGGWSGRIAKNTVKYSDNFEIEYWRPDRDVKKELDEKVDGVNCRLFPSSFNTRRFGDILSIPLLNELKKEINKNEILIHCSRIHDILTYTISYLFRDTPIIAQHHGDHSPLLLWKKKKDPIYLLAWGVEKRSLKNIAHFFVLDEEEENFIANLVGKEKVSFQVGIGIDFDKFKKLDKIESRIRLSLPVASKIMLTVCTLSERKGIEYTLKALQKIILGYPDILYLLVGDTKPDGEKFMKLTAQLHLNKYVKFLGNVDDETLLYAYNAADVFILPSLDEGLPTVLSEALACGTPIIGTNVGGTSHVIDNFRSGLLIPPKDSEAIVNAVFEMFGEEPIFKNLPTLSFMHSFTNIVN